MLDIDKLARDCAVLHDAFGIGRTFIVGSATTGSTYRDIDLRTLLPDDEFERLFPDADGLSPFGHGLCALMCNSISKYLTERTGLPIDFQIQLRRLAEVYFAGKSRIALPVSKAPIVRGVIVDKGLTTVPSNRPRSPHPAYIASGR